MGFNIKNPFAAKPTIEELEQKREYKTVELDIAKQDAMLAELKRRGGDWKLMSDNGKRNGISWSRIIEWLKTH